MGPVTSARSAGGSHQRMSNKHPKRPPRRHAHAKGLLSIGAQQRMTPEGARKRREWLRDHQEKLNHLLGREWER